MSEPFATGGGSPIEPSSPSRKTRDWSGVSFASYRIVGVLGQGGMGDVLLAEDLRLNRKVAVKILPIEYTNDPERLRRFLQEARAASALNHPNIVAIYDVGEAEVGRYIVMEYVAGQTLRDWCGEPVEFEKILNCGEQIARALVAAHAAGIVHRDIKPENIMAREDGYLKVLDFGLARLTGFEGQGSLDRTVAGLTSEGRLLGTIRYMSPEQGRGEVVSSATDIFSLGIVLYELATGNHPFAAQTQVSVLHAIISQEPIPPSRINPDIRRWFENLVVRMLSKDPAARPSAAQVVSEFETAGGLSSDAEGAPAAANLIVGREKDRTSLHTALDSAQSSGGELVCVVGEAGIGKTTLIENFLADIIWTDRRWLVGRGHCSERLSGSEAYLPFLEALESLLRQDPGGPAARAMKLLAPTWYRQTARQSATAASLEPAVSQERLKREMASFLQELTRQQPVILFFDDLHWADASTVDMLSYVAAQFRSMPLVLIVTYRPTEMLLSRHPFLSVKLDLAARGCCREVVLEYLTTADIERYLNLLFPKHRFPQDFARLIQSKTEGNALFMVDLIRYLKDNNVIQQTEQGWIVRGLVPEVERNLPESVRSMVQRKIDQLNEADRKLLVGASVQGFEFDSTSVAAAVKIDAADVEEQLERLERVHAFVRFIEEKELPDRSMTLRYRFVHVLYQNALYGSLRPTRKAQLSLTMAETLLGLYRERSAEIAANLAFLFESARDFARAADYSTIAARNALHVLANKEAATQAQHALHLMESLPPEVRGPKELAAQMMLGVALVPLKGFAAPEVENAYGRALELCESMGTNAGLFDVLYGLWSVYCIRGDYRKASELAQKLLPIAHQTQDPTMLVMANNAVGFLNVFIGDYVGACFHLDEVLRFHTREIQDSAFARFGIEPKTGSLSAAAGAYWARGLVNMSRERIREATDMRKTVKHPQSIASVLSWTASIHADFEEWEEARQWAEACMSYSHEHGIFQNVGWAMFTHGLAVAQLGDKEKGIQEMQTAMSMLDGMGAGLAKTWFFLGIAEQLGTIGDVDGGLEHVARSRAYAEQRGEAYRAGEADRIEANLLLRRIQGSDLSQPSAEESVIVADVERHLQTALATARSLSARAFELRAAIDLAALRQKQGRPAEARAVLQPVVDQFRETPDIVPVKRAGELLESLR